MLLQLTASFFGLPVFPLPWCAHIINRGSKSFTFTLTFSHFSSINSGNNDKQRLLCTNRTKVVSNEYTVGSSEFFFLKGTKAPSGPGLLRLNTSELPLSRNKTDTEQERRSYKSSGNRSRSLKKRFMK